MGKNGSKKYNKFLVRAKMDQKIEVKIFAREQKLVYEMLRQFRFFKIYIIAINMACVYYLQIIISLFAVQSNQKYIVGIFLIEEMLYFYYFQILYQDDDGVGYKIRCVCGNIQNFQSQVLRNYQMWTVLQIFVECELTGTYNMLLLVQMKGIHFTNRCIQVFQKIVISDQFYVVQYRFCDQTNYVTRAFIAS
eukprot:TRINITY_DN65557_c0_g1_i1.p2 TRINITY_DN65557_c0_g1~~TRINITY_DN65557_c0_g1_i1.p2  ORF type:complete len:192 (+),score=-8.45 TRINITY_DN65557_c0_g1_i1:268-843(+)